MKLLSPVLAFLALTAATAAHAAPAVGDQVAFQGTWDGQAVWQGISFTGYNAQTAQYRQVTVTKIGTNAPATQEDWVDAKDTASDAALQYIVANCAAQYGVPQTITVPAGTFNTCKMALQQGGHVWVGQVPFAVVRIESPVQGKLLTAELTGFTRGQ